jgi:hypothetical protein
MSASCQRLDAGTGAVVLQFPSPGSGLKAVHRPAAARRAAARRRVAFRRALLAAALFAILILVLLGGGGGTAEASHARGPRAVVMRSGQTIWDLARRYAPSTMDPRDYVDRVLEINHLGGVPGAGVRIRLPR